MTRTLTAEIVSFRAAPGISPEGMAALATGIGDWLAAQPGFIARTLSRAEDGTWTDHVVWQSLAEAQAAGRAILSEPTAAPLMGAIDAGTVIMTHAPVAARQTAPFQTDP